MEMTPADIPDLPVGFTEVWGELPFNIKLTLVHLWRAEQAAAGAYVRPETTNAATPAPVVFPVAHRQSS
jgi:hypothetical protein